MNLNIVSLKNIYKMLTDNDYPSASYPVFSKANLKGITLSSFWNRILLEEFRVGRYGQIIFRTEGARNRFFSQMCNRDKGIGFYDEYAEELDEVINIDVLIRQVNVFSAFLKNKDFNMEVLENKIKDFINYTSDKDCAYDSGVNRLLNRIIANESNIYLEGVDIRADHCGVLLTILMIMALYGQELSVQGRVGRLESIVDGAIERYLAKLNSEKDGKDSADEILIYTNKKSSLWTPAVDPNSYYGREMELFDVLDAVTDSGKTLISGPDGIGKSELLKQAIYRLVEAGDIDAIGTMTFEGSIRETFFNAFQGVDLSEISPEDNPELDEIDRIFCLLEFLQDRKTVLFIDDVDRRFVADPLFDRLSELKISVIVCSKIARIRGYYKYNIELLNVRSSVLILKAMTGKRFTPEQNQKLFEILKESKWRHTQTVAVFAKVAFKQGWDQDTIIDRLETFNSGGGVASLKRISAETDISEIGRRIIRFLAWIPFNNVESGFVIDNICTEGFDGQDIDAAWDELEELGWIDIQDNMVMAKPFINESIRKIRDIDKALECFVRKLRNEWLKGVESRGDLFSKTEELVKDYQDYQLNNMANLYFYYIEKRTGELVDRDELSLMLLAGEIIGDYGLTPYEKCIRILKCFSEDSRTDELTRFICIDILTHSNCDIGTLMKYEVLLDGEIEKENSDIPIQLLCSSALKLSYALLTKGNFDKVEDRCNWVLEHTTDPQYHYYVNFLKSICYFCCSRHDLADRMCPEFIEEHESNNILDGMSNVIIGFNSIRKHDWDRTYECVERMKNRVWSYRRIYDAYRLWLASAVEMHTGDYNKSIDGLLKARKMINAYRGDAHIESILMTEFIAFSSVASGRLDAAEALLYEARKRCEDFPGMRNIDAELCILLALIYLKTDRFPEGVELVEYISKVLKPEHFPAYYENRFLQAVILENQGCTEKALKIMEEAYPLLVSYYGADDKMMVKIGKYIDNLR